MALTREEITEGLWELSGWRIEQDQLDRLLAGERIYPDRAVGERIAQAVDVERKRLTLEFDQRGARARQEGHIEGYAAGLAKAEELRGPERPPEGLGPRAEGKTPGYLWQAADGGLWRFLGVPERESVAPVVEERKPEVKTMARRIPIPRLSDVGPDKRRCRTCDQVKDLKSDYYRDAKGNQGYKTQCKGCERDAKARKVAA